MAGVAWVLVCFFFKHSFLVVKICGRVAIWFLNFFALTSVFTFCTFFVCLVMISSCRMSSTSFPISSFFQFKRQNS